MPPRIERLAEEIAKDRFRDVRAQFLRRGARPPVLLWNPKATDLPAQPLIELLAWWAALPRAAGGLPSARLLEPDALGLAADHLLVLQPVNDALDFVHCRVARRLGQAYALELEGRPVSSLPPLDAVFAGAVCRAVLLRRQPIFTVHEPTSLLVSQAEQLAVPLGGPDGEVTRLAVAHLAEAPLRTLVDVVMDAVIAFDARGQIRLANRHAADLLGIGADELAGRRLGEVLRAGFIAAGLKTGAGLVTSAREALAQRGDGTTFPVEVSIGETRRNRQQLFVAVLRDLTARKAEEDRYRTLALTDPLTGLANRALFRERFGQAIRRAHRAGNRLALLMLDLDGFKKINDRHGHPAGDAVLEEFARRVRGMVRETDVLARLGGDEFALVQTDLHQPEAASVLAERLLTALEEPVEVDGQRVTLSVSLGVAVYPQDGDGQEQLTQNADRALYQAKRQGGARVKFFGLLEG